MRSGIHVRIATTDDVEAMASLFSMYRDHFGFPKAPEEQPLLDFLKSERVVFLAVEKEAVGFVRLQPWLGVVSMQRICSLSDLFVSSPYRGQGVGTRLLDTVTAHARAIGAQRLDLNVHHTNARAQKLYENYGFKKAVNFFHYELPLTP